LSSPGSTGAESGFTAGQRVLHQKFGPGIVAAIDGNKLTIARSSLEPLLA
jgi:hypothetical protein